jgi:hypothetical protein
MINTRVTQWSKAKDCTTADKLSVGSLELHRQSTEYTTHLDFNFKLHLLTEQQL